MENLNLLLWLMGTSKATDTLESSLAILFVATFHAPTLWPINSILQWIDFSVTPNYSYFLLFVAFYDLVPLNDFLFTTEFCDTEWVWRLWLDYKRLHCHLHLANRLSRFPSQSAWFNKSGWHLEDANTARHPANSQERRHLVQQLTRTEPA